MSATDRFQSLVLPDGDCWVWQGQTAGAGYGVFQYGGSRTNRNRIYAHRFAYEQAKGPIPDGLEVDHLCRNKRCVKPDHLEAVTHQENQRRAGPYRPRKYRKST